MTNAPLYAVAALFFAAFIVFIFAVINEANRWVDRKRMEHRRSLPRAKTRARFK